MEAQKYTDITIILDRSGSMKSVRSDTIGGFNQFLDDQKKVEGKATLALNQFDDVFEKVYGATAIKDAPHLSDKSYVPRGSTALLDAIGRTLNEAGARFSALPEHERPSKVIIVIVTDGYENASTQFTAKQIQEMITHQRDVYSWEFVYIGANQDAITTAANIGIGANNSMNYAANTAGTSALYRGLASNTSRARQNAGANMSWTAEQRKEQDKAGAQK